MCTTIRTKSNRLPDAIMLRLGEYKEWLEDFRKRNSYTSAQDAIRDILRQRKVAEEAEGQ